MFSSAIYFLHVAETFEVWYESLIRISKMFLSELYVHTADFRIQIQIIY